jgi:hypothetical protein
VRFSAKVRAKNVTGSGALWMRVDDQAGKITAFDNMVARRVVIAVGDTFKLSR